MQTVVGLFVVQATERSGHNSVRTGLISSCRTNALIEIENNLSIARGSARIDLHIYGTNRISEKNH